MKAHGALCLVLFSTFLSAQSVLSFTPVVTYSSGGFGALSSAVADLNSDGKPDLIVTNTGSGAVGTVSVLLGNGDGTFQAPVTYYSGGHEAYSVAVADVNGDGKPDLIVANTCGDGSCTTGTISVFLGKGDGTFQSPSTFSSGGSTTFSVAVADMNGDGKLDLVVADMLGSINGDGIVGVLLGNGDGTFQSAVNYDSGGYITSSAAVGDVNGDGRPDVVAANYCASDLTSFCNYGTVTVMLGNGNGTLAPPVSYNLIQISADSVTIADLNRDGRNDIVAANGSASVNVLLGNGDGTFRSAVSYSIGGYSITSVIVADLNADGIPDIGAATLCSSSSNCYGHQSLGTVQVLIGNGNGTFQAAAAFDPGGYDSISITSGDANGDGRADLFLVNECADTTCQSGTVGVLINTSTFSTSTSLLSSVNPSVHGQLVEFTGVVSHQSGKSTPTGTVTFFVGSRSIGNVRLNARGAFAVSTSALKAGSYSLTARYNGNGNYASSTSPVLTQVVH